MDEMRHSVSEIDILPNASRMIARSGDRDRSVPNAR